ncbi:hypothetical protein [Kurthia sibirica]|uniref:N-acetyltransferase domain-containing protein n=1 Tax=Kurthia sibirica TaxID=202750 RepID=A0A2U3AL50_9BACL|nr:hypothetical protein [Kurthia sibirica]PWI25260.1 hypothetical protein DEX24_09055 [Kurthia sibirica]GEK33763.1 hypothetical protein KSI01_12960 [Kurthia sibirica]
MQTATTYKYVFLTEDQHELIAEAAACLGHTFVGIKVGDKFIQEPMVGYLHLEYEDFYQFAKEYLIATVKQGYSAVALNDDDHVVGVFCGDTNKLEVIEGELFEGSFKDMNIISQVLEDVDKKFVIDFEKKYAKKMNDGEILHLFLLGVMAEEGRHEIVQELGDMLISKAREAGLKHILAEATNPKSMRLLEKFHGLTKYRDMEGQYIMHAYAENACLKAIPTTVADGTYIILKEL